MCSVEGAAQALAIAGFFQQTSLMRFGPQREVSRKSYSGSFTVRG
jgi:hypothetical protein